MILEVNNTHPRFLTGIFFTMLCAICFTSCKHSEGQMQELQGEAQGTYYSIKYLASEPMVSKAEIDLLFGQIDSSLSTYKSYSLINKLNAVDSLFIDDPWMIAMITQSDLVYRQSNGAFDPTVMPLVRAWGFGPEGNEYVAELPIDSILQKVGWNKLKIKEERNGLMLVKTVSGMQLDFNAIAQGYASDIIADYFEEKGINDYLIDTGGELRAKGKNLRGELWAIGIDKPIENNVDRSLIASFKLDNRSVATSGNYRKFYVKEGVKYAHTISPFTGRPAEHTLLSATVLSDTCSMADAYATALMVMGTENAIAFVESHPTIDAYLVYSDSLGSFQTYQSKGLEGIITERE
jgi:thiamine biosynthesis lipoprotein